MTNQEIRDWEKRFDETYHIEKIGVYSEQLIPITKTKSPIKSFISSILEAQKQEFKEMVEAELKKEDKPKCKHPVEMRADDITAQDYDCTDIHIGRAEAFSDILDQLQDKEE